jgi:hypothetical protein
MNTCPTERSKEGEIEEKGRRTIGVGGAAGVGEDNAVGLSCWEINPTFSPLISPYTLTLNFGFNCFYFYLFHHKLVYRACLIVTVSRR